MEGWLSTEEEAAHALKTKANYEDKLTGKEHTMSVFGDLDIQDISDDPFGVAESTYFCLLTESKIEVNEESGVRQLVITWTIDQPGSEYDRNKLKQRFLLPVPGVRGEDQDPEVKKSVKWLKMFLRQGCDLSETEMAKFNEDTEYVLGREGYVTTKNNTSEVDGEKRVYANVRKVLCKRLYQEKNKEAMDNAAEAGVGMGL